MKSQKSLLNPTPLQIKRRATMWADALMNNKRKARGSMRDCHGGRCCLAVAQDVAVSCGVVLETPNDLRSVPDENVKKFFGWDSTNPMLEIVVENEVLKDFATYINDGKGFPFGVGARRTASESIQSSGFSHKQIAQFVLNTFVNR